MDGKFSPPNFKEFGPSAQAEKEYKDRKKIKKLGLAYSLLFFFVLMFGWYYALNRNNAIVEEYIKAKDSLQNELFIEQTNVERYEIVIDRIKDEDSATYEKIEKYLSETE